MIVSAYSGEWGDDLNIYDVSARAGVSIATVSRVLNGSPNVSEKTRQRVLSVMEELGYTPNVFARGLGLNTMRTVGIMCSDSSDPYLASAIYHLERKLRDQGYDSILCCTGLSLANKRAYFELLLSKRVDAMILAGSKFVELNAGDNAYIIEAAAHLPVMLVNGYLDAPGIYSTLCDDHAAMYQTADLLVQSGRRDILYLYTSRSYSGANKLRGYKDALTARQIPVREEYIRRCAKDPAAARELLFSLADQGLSFNAVMTSDDSLAVGAVKFAHRRGIEIPGQLSIVGYNNSMLSYCTDPEITSVDTKIEALCADTVKRLMDVFAGRQVEQKTTIAAELVRKQTTDI